MHIFIFSSRTVPRLGRHLTFWAIYFAGTFIIQLPDISLWGHPGLLLSTAYYALIFLPIYLLAVYSTIYIVLPRYLRTRRLSLLIWHALIILAIAIPIGYYLTQLIYRSRGYNSDRLDFFAMALHNCMANLITIVGAAVIIRIMKNYWSRQREHELLAIESIRNRLHLLKMQMHPRLLFASLQKIYVALDDDTREASEMILKLSDLLSYLLYESESEQVPLNKEIQMIENYIALKKLEYKQQINLQFSTTGPLHLHRITPGLFLPLLEIGIETRKDMLKQDAINVNIQAIGPKIFFSLTNNRSGAPIVQDPTVQATLLTVRDRLRSADIKKYRLDLQTSATGLTIMMQLETSKT